LKCPIAGLHVLDVVLALIEHARESETMRGREGIEEENVNRQKKSHVIGRETEKVSGVGIMRMRAGRERVVGAQRRRVVETEDLMEVTG
jgi:hypothetical protein